MNNETIGRYRWVIVALLFFSTTINYMDRQVIGYLKPLLTKEFAWSNSDFALVTSCFTFCYAGITLIAGLIIDIIGTKMGLAISLIVWSFFGVLNAFCGTTVLANAIVRSLFGIGEAGNFPASIKTVTEWFPKKERSLATGIFNSGSNVGAMIAALLVPYLASRVWFGGSIQGWQFAYILTGSVGLFWLIFWFIFYDVPSKQSRLGKAEYAYIHSDDVVKGDAVVVEKEKVSWFKLFSYRQTWSFFFGKFMTDGIWWFLLFWLPDFLTKQFNMTIEQVKWPSFVVYGIAIVGSVTGGSLPMFFMNRGMQAYQARMTAMFIIASLPVLLLLTPYFGNVAHFGTSALYLTMVVICIGAAAHQAWSANLFTTVSDMFPKKAVGSVTGIGAMAGGFGGVLIQQLAGFLTDKYKAAGIKEFWGNLQTGALHDAGQKVLQLKPESINLDKTELTLLKKDVAAPIIDAVGKANWEALIKLQGSFVQPQVSNAYMIMFGVCAFAYLVAWTLMKLFVPKFRPITDL